MEQLSFAELQCTVTYEQIESMVKQMLRGYRRLNARIRSAEMKARGIGLLMPLRYPQEKIESLAAVGSAYVVGMPCGPYMYQQKAENLFHAVRGDDEEDEKALDEIRGIMIGTSPWGGEGYLDENGRVVAFKEEAMRRWKEEAKRLREEQEVIETALESLKEYAPDLERLLRMRYIQGYSVAYVADELDMSQRTYARRKRDAILEFAHVAGLI